ncbi:MAG: hypothetical protein JST84_26010 [Acidobacteria bacterium]|nr:hypothetical protein [Acidobacteriota bacterium]
METLFDSNLKDTNPREVQASRVANWLWLAAVFYAASFAVGFIPVVNFFALLLHFALFFLYPLQLLIWLLMYAFRLDRSNPFNRKTYRDVWLSLGLWMVTNIIQLAILLISRNG